MLADLKMPGALEAVDGNPGAGGQRRHDRWGAH